MTDLKKHEEFLKDVCKEFTMVGEDLFAVFPGAFRQDEVLFFSAVPDLFSYTKWNEREKGLIGRISLILYVSMKLHILVDSKEVEKGHRLEMAVLAGDYLSGRFTELCVRAKAFELFDAWLEYLLRVSRELATLSLQGAELEEKHSKHASMLMDMLLRLNEGEDRERASKVLAQTFLQGHWDDLDARQLLPHKLSARALNDLRTFFGRESFEQIDAFASSHPVCS